MKRHDPESAHAAFLEAARLLKDASAGTPVLALEWAVIQTLVSDAAGMFDDLPLVLAPPLSFQLPRRWWQMRPVVGRVDQKFLTVHVAVDAAEPRTSREAMFEVTSFLLGRDGVLRIHEDFPRAVRSDMLPLGWMPPDSPRMKDLFYWNIAPTASPILLNEIEVEEAERILIALEHLAVLTRDRVASRLKRLRDRDHV